MAGAFEIVMAERKALVDKIIGMMQKGDFFRNKDEWDRAALRPQNPLSKVWYRGGNRMKLMAVMAERGYRDPRWATAKQLVEKGYHIRSGEHGIICEKWIFEKEKKTKIADGEDLAAHSINNNNAEYRELTDRIKKRKIISKIISKIKKR